MNNRILTHEQIEHIAKRIAYQIYETNVDEKEIVIAGINGGGLQFAKKIATILGKITDANIVLCKVDMDKSNPLKSGVQTSIPEADYKNKSIVFYWISRVLPIEINEHPLFWHTKIMKIN